jgi:pyruvate kinase
MVSVTLKELPLAVSPGNILFINDGLIQVQVEKIAGEQVHCRVLVGGKLRSKKGLNLPGIDLGISAFTEHDKVCMRFALENGVDAISQSFVNDAADIEAVRTAAAAMGFAPFIIAKIERASILDKIDEIMEAADGVMVARGDLGVELPIEEIAIMQKMITARANLFGKPVITATQMLESMTNNRRPTRAEATDVANAILDGTDCVMLSEESAMGRYPLEAVRMLVQIAVATEPHRTMHSYRKTPEHPIFTEIREVDYIASSVSRIVSHSDTVAAILAPTDSGLTARRLSRYKLPTWVLGSAPTKKPAGKCFFPTAFFRSLRSITRPTGPISPAITPSNFTSKAAASSRPKGLPRRVRIATTRWRSSISERFCEPARLIGLRFGKQEGKGRIGDRSGDGGMFTVGEEVFKGVDIAQPGQQTDLQFACCKSLQGDRQNPVGAPGDFGKQL